MYLLLILNTILLRREIPEHIQEYTYMYESQQVSAASNVYKLFKKQKRVTRTCNF